MRTTFLRLRFVSARGLYVIQALAWAVYVAPLLRTLGLASNDFAGGRLLLWRSVQLVRQPIARLHRGQR